MKKITVQINEYELYLLNCLANRARFSKKDRGIQNEAYAVIYRLNDQKKNVTEEDATAQKK